jgi:hypothetical protein
VHGYGSGKAQEGRESEIEDVLRMTGYVGKTENLGSSS